MSDIVITKTMMRHHPEMATMAKLELFVVFSSPSGGLGPVMAQMPAHLQHQIDLERRGIMFAAGPLFGDDGEIWAGDGMFVLRAASMADAVEIAKSDPMHASGARTFRIRPWMLNEGTLTIRVSLSQGTATLA